MTMFLQKCLCSWYRLKKSFYVSETFSSSYRENICLQTLLLLFKFANHRNKRPFVSTANEALVGTLMTIVDVIDIFPIVYIICIKRRTY